MPGLMRPHKARQYLQMERRLEKLTAEELEAGLRHFYGGDTVYRHPLMRRVVFTEGAAYLADNAGAHWLLDEIATSQMLKEVAAEEFQTWKLKVDTKKCTGVLTCGDGGKNGRASRTVYTKRLDYTDFPLPEIALWFENDTICLPSER